MKKVILIAILVLIVGSMVFGCGNSEETTPSTATFTPVTAWTPASSPGSTLAGTGEELLNQAQDLQSRGDYEGAIENYQAFVDGEYYLFQDGEYFSSYEAEKAIGAIYRAWAEELASQGRYSEAIEKYQAFIDGDYFLSEDGEYYSSHDAGNAIGAIYKAWAEELESQGQYGEAIAYYQAFIDGEYLVSEDGEYFSSYDAGDAIGSIYKAWAEELVSQGKYGEAIEKYQAFIDGDYFLSEDGGYFSSYYAEKLIEDYRYFWAQELESEGDYEAAIAQFSMVTYSSDYYEDAQAALPDCCYSWVTQLKSQGQYQQAVEEYVLVLEQYPTTAWASSENGDKLLQGMPASELLQSMQQLLDEERIEGAAWVYAAILDLYPTSPQASSAQQILADAIDAYVSSIASGQHGELPSFTTASDPAGGSATVEIRNACPYVISVSFSGPETKALFIECHPEAFAYVITPFGNPSKYKVGTIQLQPGQYRIVARVSDTSISPWYGEMNLTQDQKYTTYFYILQSWG